MKNRSYLLFFIVISILLTITAGCGNTDAFGTIPEPVDVPTSVALVEVQKVAKLAPTTFPTPTNRPRNTPTLIPTLRPTATETTVPTATTEPTATVEPTATIEPTAAVEPATTPVEEAAVESAESEASETEASANDPDAGVLAAESETGPTDAVAPEAEVDTETDSADVEEPETDSVDVEEPETDSVDVETSEDDPDTETDSADVEADAETLDADTETDAVAVASADEVVRSPAELRTGLGCTACHNATEKHDPANPAQPGPNQATLHEYAGERIPGMSAEEYLYESIANGCAYMVEGYTNCLMLVDYTEQMSEAELDGLIAWLLDPNRQ